jgi:hypothetical protein
MTKEDLEKMEEDLKKLKEKHAEFEAIMCKLIEDSDNPSLLKNRNKIVEKISKYAKDDSKNTILMTELSDRIFNAKHFKK